MCGGFLRASGAVEAVEVSRRGEERISVGAEEGAGVDVDPLLFDRQQHILFQLMISSSQKMISLRQYYGPNINESTAYF